MTDMATRERVRQAVELLIEVCHGLARQSGWWSRPDALDEKMTFVRLGLIHTEISEAFEAARKDKADSHLPEYPGLTVELADGFIRICDMSGGERLALSHAVVDKLAYNQVRADHKLEVRAQAGGKKV